MTDSPKMKIGHRFGSSIRDRILIFMKSNWGIICLAIALRLVLVGMAIQDIVLIYSDGTAHVMRAWQWHQDPTLATLKELHIWYVWLPGEAIWLSLPMFFVNDILIATWISSLAFSLATMVVVYGIAKEVYGSKNARISVIIVAILPQAVWYSTGAVMDTFSNFFMLLAVWGILLGYKRNPIYFLVSGVALALGNLTRYESWIFTGVITLVLIYIILRSHKPQRLAALAVTIPFVLLSSITPLLWFQWNNQFWGDPFHFMTIASNQFSQGTEGWIEKTFPPVFHLPMTFLCRLVSYPSFVGEIYTVPIFPRSRLGDLEWASWRIIGTAIVGCVLLLILRNLCRLTRNQRESHVTIYLLIVLLGILAQQGLAVLGNIPTSTAERSILFLTLLILPFLTELARKLMHRTKKCRIAGIEIGIKKQQILVSLFILIWMFAVTFPIRDQFVAHRRDTLPAVGFFLEDQWKSGFLEEEDLVLFEIVGFGDLNVVRITSNHPNQVFPFEEGQIILERVKIVIRSQPDDFSTDFSFSRDLCKGQDLRFVYVRIT